MIESKELPQEFVSIRQVWLKQIDRVNEALSKRYMMDVKDDRTDSVGMQMVIESINAFRLNLINFGEATIKNDVAAWIRVQKQMKNKESNLEFFKRLFAFIIQTLNKYGMLFDSQPKGFSNVEMKSIHQ